MITPQEFDALMVVLQRTPMTIAEQIGMSYIIGKIAHDVEEHAKATTTVEEHAKATTTSEQTEMSNV